MGHLILYWSLYTILKCEETKNMEIERKTNEKKNIVLSLLYTPLSWQSIKFTDWPKEVTIYRYQAPQRGNIDQSVLTPGPL